MNSVVYRQHFMATGGEMSNGLHNDVLNGKNCLKRFLFDQNFALQGLYFDQNFEKCTLVVGHFILNQIFKNVEKGQGHSASGVFFPVKARFPQTRSLDREL